jgi:hypothetical protein
MKTYSLLPFTDPAVLTGNRPLSLEIFVHVAFVKNKLSLSYELSGEMTAIALAPVNPTPQRRDHLWETTCFECFLAPQNSSQYWEFNLSPSRDWNCYRFEDYRTGMIPETAWPGSPFQIDQQVAQNKRYLLNCQIDLNLLFPEPVPLQLGITLVIAQTDGTVSYWALSHPGPKADFHQRDSWLISLAEPRR